MPLNNSISNSDLIALIAANKSLVDVVDSISVKKDIVYELGGIGTSNGANRVDANRIRNVGYLTVADTQKIVQSAEIKYSLRYYNDANAFLGYTDWKTGECRVLDYTSQFAGTTKIRVSFAYTNDANITDVPSIAAQIAIYKYLGTAEVADDVANKFIGFAAPFDKIGSFTNATLTTYATTDYVPVVMGDIVDYRCRVNNGTPYIIYDTYMAELVSGTILSGAVTRYGTLVMPSGAAYIRVQTLAPTHASYAWHEPLLRVYGASNNRLAGNIQPSESQTGNVSIVCAKEQTYNDGTPPKAEYYLLEDIYNNFSLSRDLKDKRFIFNFGTNSHFYTFGILQNGDIIACRFADTLTETKSDANRVNPYVYLASEKWTIKHEVNFGVSLKPCGWLSNCGFRVLPDGSAVFCEYTRLTTETSNVWRVLGNPLDPANWTVTKSFPITNPGDNTLFKHCHTIQHDHYTGVVYVTTGDDNVGSMMWASTNNGVTWTQLLSPDSNGIQDSNGWYGGSEKYCRLLTFTFTADYIYWGSDTWKENLHYLFKAARDVNGVLDYTTVNDYVLIPVDASNVATYGTAYLPELNAILLLERSDLGEVTSMPVRLVDLSDGTLKTIATLQTPVGGSAYIGFRTRHSEWYPDNGFIRIGFMMRVTPYAQAVNQIRGFGNGIAGNTPSTKINNLTLRVYKNGDIWGIKLGTLYL